MRRHAVALAVGILLVVWSVIYASFPAQSDGIVTVRESMCTYIPLVVGLVLIARSAWGLFSSGVLRLFGLIRKRLGDRRRHDSE